MRCRYRSFLVGVVVLSLMFVRAAFADSSIAPWQEMDIGNVGIAGSSSLSNGVFTVSGSGLDVGGAADSFHYVYQPVNGDTTIIARITSISSNSGYWAKTGIMIRENLTPQAKNAFVLFTKGGGVAFTYRDTANSGYPTVPPALQLPAWIKLIRSGNVFLAYRSLNGTQWIQVGSPVTINMTSTVYVGLAVSSRSNSILHTSQFDSVNLTGNTGTPPAAPVLNTATPGNGKVDLAWSAVSGATGYKIFCGTSSGTYTATVDGGNVTSYAMTGLTNDTPYYLAVKAYNSGGDSSYSNEKTATPVAPPPYEYITNVDYNASGQISKIEFGNGNITTHTYDPLTLRLMQIKTVNSADTVIQDLNYSYDSVGNILQIVDNINTADQAFQYDALGRLKQATGSYGTKTYQYDEIGNITTKEGLAYTYGQNGAGPHAVTSLSDGTTFTYDANGNMATKVENDVTTQYIYDVENRLIEAKRAGTTIGTYGYDGDGGRTKKISGSPTPQTTRFVGSLFEESGSRETGYIFLGDMRVASLTGSEVLYYHADHLGGANLLSDDTGVVKELTEYEPFGQYARHEKYGNDEEVAWFYFTGKKLDDETGLYYYGARYYDPEIGRFITADSIVPRPGNPQEFNRYSYVLNNPINAIDPTGHWSWKKFWKSFAGAFIGGAVAVLSAGAGAPLWAAGMAGGFLGGAVTGGLNGGWQGALYGGLMGGAFGGLVGWGAGIAQAHGMGGWYAGGLLLAGAVVASTSNNWDSFLGGLAGGFVGGSLANGYLSAKQDNLSEQNPTEGIRAGVSVKDNENIAFLGVGTTEEKAIAFANQNQTSVIYTPSRGILSDLFRAGFKLLGMNGPYAQQSANYLNVAEGKFILAHSEGTLNLAAGIKLSAANAVKFTNLDIKWIGPLVSERTAANLSNLVGASSSHSLNFGDPVGVFSTSNPIKMAIYGGVGLATLTYFHGTNQYVR